MNIYDEIAAEVARARAKFPRARLTTVALMEEVGELAKALMDEPTANVRKEAIQVACMAIRVAEDGDVSVDAVRRDHGLDVHPTIEVSREAFHAVHQASNA